MSRIIRRLSASASPMLLLLTLLLLTGSASSAPSRARTSLNAGWRFNRFASNPDSLSYSNLKPYMLPAANNFISGSTKFSRPSGTAPGSNIDYTQLRFNDSSWDAVTLPHDWAIKGPFRAPNVGTEMATLPSFGVGWYRRKISRAASEEGLSFLLDIDGAMSYAAVWLNGNLVGGWPFGYASFRLDLTPYMKTGDDNILAIRLDNPNDNSRWYPGGGLYRNVWLNKVKSTRVAQYGTSITTSSTSTSSANVSLVVQVENSGSASSSVDVATEIRIWNPATQQPGAEVIGAIPKASVTVPANGKLSTAGSATVTNPKLWGPAPGQKPNMYVAITTVSVAESVVDTYQTPFGIRTITYDANKGILVNGQAVRIQGTNNHHDLGSLGAAFNVRAAERQMEILQEMGCNALRTSHNPPAQEFLDLADQRGILILNEIFDAWTETRRTNDFAKIFADWKEADIRLWVRRDRNHPSVIAWSVGNEVPEQGAANIGSIVSPLKDYVKGEDPTRPVTASVNAVGPGALTNVLDLVSLNYLGEGMGSSNYGSAYPNFKSAYSNKMMWASESSAAVSTRGVFFFPPASGVSASYGDQGGTVNNQISGYELYAAGFGNSADKTFVQQDKYSYVAGEFVWTGFDYLGEPHPLTSPRSSSFGIIDMAGFKKERFWLYQARWRPDHPMVHILPHWTWPDRAGQSVPIHVFSGADEVELFVNNVSQGRIKKGASSYRFRFDKVVYQPGNVRAVGYKNGQQWATETIKTVGSATKLSVTADRTTISGDGYDLSFITVAVADSDGLTVPRSSNSITFTVSGPGALVSTDNGDNTDFTAFPSATRKAFGGLLLGIVRANPGATGEIVVTASSSGLTSGSVTIKLG